MFITGDVTGLRCARCRLDEHLVVKVADFGLSRDIFTRDYYASEDKRAKLPIKWMAPESLSRAVYSIKSDVVSGSTAPPSLFWFNFSNV